jgi:hypothetical protein
MQGDGRFPDLRAFVAFEWQYDELDDLAGVPEDVDSAAITEDRARLDAMVHEEAQRTLRGVTGVTGVAGPPESPA